MYSRGWNTVLKPWPKPSALAFRNPRPGQKPSQAMTLAQLGQAYLGLAWPGCQPQAGPGTALSVTLSRFLFCAHSSHSIIRLYTWVAPSSSYSFLFTMSSSLVPEADPFVGFSAWRKTPKTPTPYFSPAWPHNPFNTPQPPQPKVPTTPTPIHIIPATFQFPTNVPLPVSPPGDQSAAHVQAIAMLASTLAPPDHVVLIYHTDFTTIRLIYHFIVSITAYPPVYHLHF